MSEPPSSHPVAWSPPFAVRVLLARFVTRAPRRVDAMMTTALHGAVGHALKELACLRAGQPCGACASPDRCAYAGLFEGPPPTAAAAAVGVTSRAPPAMILAPRTPVRGNAPVDVDAGYAIEFEVVLIGADALAQTSLVVAALRGAARRGLGGGPDRRAPLVLEAVDEVEPTIAPPCARARLRLLTPTRLLDQGHVRGAIDADLLWRSSVRRVELLARLHVGGPTLPEGVARAAPFTLDEAAFEMVRMRRYSSRQARGLDLPGVVGTALLEGEGLARACGLLSWAGLLGVGKGTSMGFGRFTIEPLR